jgi:hypothetical protein
VKITIEDEQGKQLTLETALTVIPPGHAVLICPADKEHFISVVGKEQLTHELAAIGIRAVVAQLPVHVWAIADHATA